MGFIYGLACFYFHFVFVSKLECGLCLLFFLSDVMSLYGWLEYKMATRREYSGILALRPRRDVDG